MCWLIGAALIVNDENSNFDLRFQTRGPRPASPEIIVIDISERDLAELDPDSRNVLRPMREVVSFTDAFFWNERAWGHLLERILQEDPAAIGVTFLFGENIRLPRAYNNSDSIFLDPRIIWGAGLDSSGRVLVPVFAGTYNSNVGLLGLRPDPDGILRRFSTSLVQIPHMAVRLAEKSHPGLTNYISKSYLNPTLINYNGNADTYRVVAFSDIVGGRIPLSMFRDRIVIIGSLSSSFDQMQTPLGRMSRTEIIANITNNVISKMTVFHLPTPVYMLMLLALMIGSLWILSSYPQSIALVFFILIGTVWAALSAWAFDVMFIWIPVLSPIVQLTVTYIVFLSYQLALNEQRTWRLEQEQKYLSEIEQLKTNFVSMMSHDLKTPIAKIQAICDRLLTMATDQELSQDLKSLRRSSDELHRYIQSILQVTKVEAKDFKIQKEVTDINENIERVVGRLQPLAAEKGLSLSMKLEPMFSIEVDTTLIQEVVHNLLENAIKYTPSGGHIVITSEEKDDNVVVVVEDTGPGIDPEDQNEVWGKFNRGRRQNMEIKGTGLGLYLVKYFVELHGGQVFLVSTPGKGTRVGFMIPVAEETSEAS